LTETFEDLPVICELPDFCAKTAGAAATSAMNKRAKRAKLFSLFFIETPLLD
jgi:hypothetical protein